MVSSKQLKALLVRTCLALHIVLVVWRVTVAWEQLYWLLLVAILPFLLEALFTILKRDGVEWRQFSVCFFFYLCATLPGIWLLEIQKTNVYQSGNFSQVEDVVISGVEIPVRLSPDTWVLVVEEAMLYLMILGRWAMPRGDVGREQLTQLLFGFIGIASDIMELFSLFDEDKNIRTNTVLVYVILSTWSLSVLQFTLTFVTAHRPRRARGLRTSPSVRNSGLDPTANDLETIEEQDRRHKLSVLRVELLATVLSLLMQDGPFLVVRLYTMILYNLLTYSLMFFTCKNALVALLLIYKIFLLLCKICCPSRLSHKPDKEDLEDVFQHPHLDTTIVVPQAQGRKGFPQDGDPDSSGDLRKRRDETGVYNGGSADLEDWDMKKWDGKGDAGRDTFEMNVGDLQMAIEGAATPAKPMEKTKRYDKLLDHSKEAGTAKDNTMKKQRGEKEGTDNPALEQDEEMESSGDPGSDGIPQSGRKESLARNENPGGKNSSGSGGPNRKASVDQKEDDTHDSSGREDHDRKEPSGGHGDAGMNDSQDWDDDPGRQKSLDEMKVPVQMRATAELEPTHTSKRHVSLIKVPSLAC